MFVGCDLDPVGSTTGLRGLSLSFYSVQCGIRHCTVQCTVQYTESEPLITAYLSSELIPPIAHTLALSSHYPGLRYTRRHTIGWLGIARYCVVACFRHLQSSLWQDGLVLAGVIWPWPDSRPLARATGGGGDTMLGPNTVVSCQPASKQNSFTAHNKALQTLAPDKHLAWVCCLFLIYMYRVMIKEWNKSFYLRVKL